MKGWILDFHNSATRDIKLILEDLGHQITRESLSGHSWVFNEKKSDIECLKNLKLEDFDLNTHKLFDEYLINNLKDYDFFVTGHTPCLSLLFKNTNKPVIILISTRYEWPFSGNSYLWQKFNEFLQEKYASKQFYFVANNYYDAEYFYYYTGIKPYIAQSICHYLNDAWKPTNNQWLLNSKLLNIDIQGLKLKNLRDLKKYSFQELYSYAGMYYIPYQVSTMSLFEYSAAGMPIYYPDIETLIKLNSTYQKRILSEITWLNINPNLSQNDHNSIKSYGNKPSPNNINDEMLTEWLPYSDAYTPWLNNIIGKENKINNQEKYNIFKNVYKNILEILNG